MKKLVMLTAVATLSISAIGLSQADELTDGIPASTSIEDVAEAQEAKEEGTLLEPKAAVDADAPAQADVVPVVDSPIVLELIERYPNMVSRIHPYGVVCYEGEDCDVTTRSAGASSDGGPRDGKTVYNQVCQTCHAAGLLGAPTYGDASAWAPRIAQGKDTLYDHAINGIGNMPAKGGADIPDEEVQSAVDYMVENSQ